MIRWIVLSALWLVACHERPKAETAASKSEAVSVMDDAGVAALCSEPCPSGSTCKLVMVVCVRAPCPPIPQCVPDKK
jgi:hypothetical protein